MAFYMFLVVVVTCLMTFTSSQLADEWNAMAQSELNAALSIKLNTGVAKNVILFIGDGMGVSTVTAARIYKGQTNNQTGEETVLNMETFPHVALSKRKGFVFRKDAAGNCKLQELPEMGSNKGEFPRSRLVLIGKTYSVDRQTTDSACAATAFLCGVKANSGTTGVDARVKRKSCDNFEAAKVQSVLKWAETDGKATGIVTTTRLTHATPSAAYAHTPERKWEGDAAMDSAGEQCKVHVKDIARQLVEDNPHIQVLLGGGRQYFQRNNDSDPETMKINEKLGRRDGKDLTKIWKDSKPVDQNAVYVWNKKQFDAVDPVKTDFLLGLFNPGHMEHELKRDPNNEPSLADMVAKAIQILRRNKNGFFLLVEGGIIDQAHHNNQAKLALADTVAMDDAIGVAKEMTAEEDTLIVVTADHSHVFNIAGYPKRGNNILGIVDLVDDGDEPTDSMPYATLVYANGPGPLRQNLTGVDTTADDHKQSVAVPMASETHGGEDVGIYASGPMAHLFHGVHEQNYVAHVMAYSACIGPYSQSCSRDKTHEVGADKDRTIRLATTNKANSFKGNGSVSRNRMVLTVICIYLVNRFFSVRL